MHVMFSDHDKYEFLNIVLALICQYVFIFTESIQKNPEIEEMDLESSSNADSDASYASKIVFDCSYSLVTLKGSEYFKDEDESLNAVPNTHCNSQDSFSNISQFLPPSPISHDDANNDKK